MEAPKDKRTKAYKEWVKAQQEDTSSGIGDAVEKITKATGIKKAVDYVFDKLGKDCNCDKRKEKLNNLFRKKVNCFTEEQYNKWTEFKNRDNKTEVTHSNQVDLIIPIYEHLFNVRHKKSSCGSCVKKLINEIDRVYEQYQ